MRLKTQDERGKKRKLKRTVNLRHERGKQRTKKGSGREENVET